MEQHSAGVKNRLSLPTPPHPRMAAAGSRCSMCVPVCMCLCVCPCVYVCLCVPVCLFFDLDLRAYTQPTAPAGLLHVPLWHPQLAPLRYPAPPEAPCMASGRSHMLPCLRLYGSTPDEALPAIAATTQHSVTFVASDDATTWLTMSKTLHGVGGVTSVRSKS